VTVPVELLPALVGQPAADAAFAGLAAARASQAVPKAPLKTQPLVQGLEGAARGGAAGGGARFVNAVKPAGGHA
jgi:hypothetical protein